MVLHKFSMDCKLNSMVKLLYFNQLGTGTQIKQPLSAI